MRPIPGYPRTRELAMDWGARLHAEKGLTYGDGLPYRVHLEAVDAVLVRFGFSDPDNPVHQNLRTAAPLHDLKEDVGVGPVTIRVLHGPDVLDLVEAVTSEPGKNRAEKVAATLPKTRAAGQWAVVLKLADRIANVEASAPGSRHLEMYRSEYPAFRGALYQAGEPSEAMWAHLDQLIKAAPELATEEPKPASQPAAAEPQARIV